MSHNFTWKGKEPEDLSKEELLKALQFVINSAGDMMRYSNDREVQDLKKELDIKNDVIERLIRR